MAWSDQQMPSAAPRPAPEPANATGHLPVRRLRQSEPALSRPGDFEHVAAAGPAAAAAARHGVASGLGRRRRKGRMLLLDVYDGLETMPRGTIQRLRLVGVPPKTHPTMNFPEHGPHARRPGQVRARHRAGRDGRLGLFPRPVGRVVLLPGPGRRGRWPCRRCGARPTCSRARRYTCVGCHEPRSTAPPNLSATAARARAVEDHARPGRLLAARLPGPRPAGARQQVRRVPPAGGTAPKIDLTAAKAYDTLVGYGKPSLAEHVQARYRERPLDGRGRRRADQRPAVAPGNRPLRRAADRRRLGAADHVDGHLRPAAGFVRPGAGGRTPRLAREAGHPAGPVSGNHSARGWCRH